MERLSRLFYAELRASFVCDKTRELGSRPAKKKRAHSGSLFLGGEPLLLFEVSYICGNY